MSKTAIGDCVVRRLDDGTVHVEQADPLIYVAPDQVDRWRAGVDDLPGITFKDDVFRIEGTNQTVVYRLGGLTTDQCGSPVYLAEWPD